MLCTNILIYLGYLTLLTLPYEPWRVARKLVGYIDDQMEIFWEFEMLRIGWQAAIQRLSSKQHLEGTFEAPLANSF